MPTSITVAPGFTISFFTNLGLPIAEITISALLITLSISFVLEWQTVTVQFLFSKHCIIGFPTILLLPKITASFPSVSILYSSNNFIIP